MMTKVGLYEKLGLGCTTANLEALPKGFTEVLSDLVHPNAAHSAHC